MKDYSYADISVMGILDGDPMPDQALEQPELSVRLREASGVRMFSNDWPSQGTNKVVTVSAYYTGTFRDESLSLHLTPVMALVLVRRLIDTLDRCQREDPSLELPQIHSSFVKRLSECTFEGATLGAGDLETYLGIQQRWENSNQLPDWDAAEEVATFTTDLVDRILKRGPTHPTSDNDNS